MANIKLLANKVPPRVHFCSILLGYHGWPTAHRTGKGKSNACPLCREGSDSTAHLLCCKVVKSVMEPFVGTLDFQSRASFLLLSKFNMSFDEVVLASLINFGIYTACNMARHSDNPPTVLPQLIIDHASAAAEGCSSFPIWLSWVKHRKALAAPVQLPHSSSLAPVTDTQPPSHIG